MKLSVTPAGFPIMAAVIRFGPVRSGCGCWPPPPAGLGLGAHPTTSSTPVSITTVDRFQAVLRLTLSPCSLPAACIDCNGPDLQPALKAMAGRLSSHLGPLILSARRTPNPP